MTVFDQVGLRWHKINWRGDLPKSGRIGHSLTSFRKYVILFGGCEGHNVTNDSRIINIE